MCYAWPRFLEVWVILVSGELPQHRFVTASPWSKFDARPGGEQLPSAVLFGLSEGASTTLAERLLNEKQEQGCHALYLGSYF